MLKHNKYSKTDNKILQDFKREKLLNWKELILHGQHSIWSGPRKEMKKKVGYREEPERINYLYPFLPHERHIFYQFPSNNHIKE